MISKSKKEYLKKSKGISSDKKLKSGISHDRNKGFPDKIGLKNNNTKTKLIK